MIRVVLDTNIVVSAMLNSRGAPAEVLRLALTDPEIQLCVTAAIYAEYEEVIRRPRFHRSDSEVLAALQAIRSHAVWVRQAEEIHICSDPDDDIFLACAIPATAHFVITGNQRHFPPTWENIRIVTAREFLDLL